MRKALGFDSHLVAHLSPNLPSMSCPGADVSSLTGPGERRLRVCLVATLLTGQMAGKNDRCMVLCDRKGKLASRRRSIGPPVPKLCASTVTVHEASVVPTVLHCNFKDSAQLAHVVAAVLSHTNGTRRSFAKQTKTGCRRADGGARSNLLPCEPRGSN